jgi:hypothetical protein
MVTVNINGVEVTMPRNARIGSGAYPDSLLRAENLSGKHDCEVGYWIEIDARTNA